MKPAMDTVSIQVSPYYIYPRLVLPEEIVEDIPNLYKVLVVLARSVVRDGVNRVKWFNDVYAKFNICLLNRQQSYYDNFVPQEPSEDSPIHNIQLQIDKDLTTFTDALKKIEKYNDKFVKYQEKYARNLRIVNSRIKKLNNNTYLDKISVPIQKNCFIVDFNYDDLLKFTCVNLVKLGRDVLTKKCEFNTLDEFKQLIKNNHLDYTEDESSITVSTDNEKIVFKVDDSIYPPMNETKWKEMESVIEKLDVVKPIPVESGWLSLLSFGLI